MPEIIPPSSDRSKKSLKRAIMSYGYLFVGVVFIIIGLSLLIEIALGLMFLFLGSIVINYWMIKK